MTSNLGAKQLISRWVLPSGEFVPKFRISHYRICQKRIRKMRKQMSNVAYSSLSPIFQRSTMCHNTVTQIPVTNSIQLWQRFHDCINRCAVWDLACSFLIFRELNGYFLVLSLDWFPSFDEPGCPWYSSTKDSLGTSPPPPQMIIVVLSIFPFCKIIQQRNLWVNIRVTWGSPFLSPCFMQK